MYSYKNMDSSHTIMSLSYDESRTDEIWTDQQTDSIVSLRGDDQSSRKQIRIKEQDKVSLLQYQRPYKVSD